MSFFSSCIKIIFITSLAFSLYSGNSVALARHVCKPPNCDAYKDMDRSHVCKNQVDAVCASNGRTYANECVFCTIMLDIHVPFTFQHYGKCQYS